MSPFLADHSPWGLWVLLLLLIPSLLLLHRLKRRRPPPLRLPPGPRGLPIIGNLHQLGHLPHRSLHRLSSLHGPLMHLRLGQVPTLVISSPAAAKQVLKTHDLAFCSRPPLTAWHKLSYGRLDPAFAPYGDYWRHVRKLTTLELLGSKRVLSSRPLREDEVAVLLRAIAASTSHPVNLSEMFLSLLNNINSQEVFGRRASKEGNCWRSPFHDMINETVALIGGFCAGDFFPSTPWLNVLTGMQARLEKNFREMDAFLEEEIEEARRRGGGDSFVNILLELQNHPTAFPLSDNHIKAILMDTFIAGTDTASLTLVWAMTELMKSPIAMRKAQEEVRVMAAGKGRVEESELEQLRYLSSVVKETLRLHPPAPLLLPRQSREDCNIDGYDIPSGTTVYINAWTIGRDPGQWEDPLVFRPERFDGSGVDYKGQHFQLIPFGGGRRICPGMAQGTVVVELALANLLYSFEWSLPEGMTKDGIDMEESFGLAVSKKQPLLLMATPIVLEIITHNKKNTNTTCKREKIEALKLLLISLLIFLMQNKDYNVPFYRLRN